ncbi:hypothetical protein OXX69_010677, partial [Metschnikowia pulcherrima]
MLHHLRITIGNVHCLDCEASIRQALSKHLAISDLPEPFKSDLPYNIVYYSLEDGVINLLYNSEGESDTGPFQGSLKHILHSLKKAGFSVLSCDLTGDGKIVLSSESRSLPSTEPERDVRTPYSFSRLWRNYKRKQDMRHHLNNCTSCQIEKRKVSDARKEDSREDGDSSDESKASTGTLLNATEQEYRAVFSITGMTCA